MKERSETGELTALQARALAFRDARDWSQFHDPKNLAEAISIEAAELLELFLWKEAAESRHAPADLRARAGEELADLLIFMLYMAHGLGLDLVEEAHRKLGSNETRYPVEKARGSSRKYTELD